MNHYEDMCTAGTEGEEEEREGYVALFIYNILMHLILFRLMNLEN
jgi:hypothetical protein